MRAALLSAPTARAAAISSRGSSDGSSGQRQRALLARPVSAAARGARRSSVAVKAHRVELEMEDGTSHFIEVSPDETILSVALEKDLLPPYDCQMGVCLKCAAKLVEGTVDQEAGMLSEDVQQKGYALLCVSLPTSDCKIKVIPEYELMDEALATSAVNQARAAS